MKRSASVLVAAIVQLIGSSFTLLIALTPAIVFLTLRHHHGARPGFPGAMLFVPILYGGLALAGFATAIGVLLLKQWARISTLVFSCFLVACCTFASLILFLLPMTERLGASEPTFHMIKIVLGALAAVPAFIGAWWLFLFTRTSVAAQFSAQPAQAAAPAGPVGFAPVYSTPQEPLSLAARRPVSITVIACFMLLGVATSILSPLWVHHPVAAFFLWPVSGWAAVVLILSFAVVYLVVGVGLLRLRPWSRIATMLWLVFGVADLAAFYCTPGVEARYQRMAGAVRTQWETPSAGSTEAMILSMMPWIVLFTALIALVQIYFLITRRTAFAPPAEPPAACQTPQIPQ